MIRRLGSVKTPLSKIFNNARQARKLEKLLQKGLEKEKKVQPSKLLTKKYLPTAYENEFCNRRMSVLNKVFTEKLTEMMNQVDCADLLNELQIEISKVKVHKSYEFIDVFWISQKVGTPEKIINDTLRRVLRQLQERIGNSTTFRRVPCLRFIRDFRLENEKNLEKTFKLIDLGKDNDPVYQNKVCTSKFTKSLEDFPVMRQNVLGLDVSEIKGRIMAQVSKFKAININTTDGELVPKPSISSHKLIQFNKKDFVKYYKRRRIEELKLRKKERNDFYETYEVGTPMLWNKFEVPEENYEESNDEIYEEVEEINS